MRAPDRLSSPVRRSQTVKRIMTSHLIVPGLGSSGSDHWQSWLETVLPNASRVRQWNWDVADLPAWSARIRHHLSRAIEDHILIAHSFGALVAAQAAIDLPDNVAGVLLVAPADPVHFRIEETSVLQPLGVPAIVVASASDKWMSIERAKHFAGHWGAELVSLGDAGHINAEAGLGAWPAALGLVRRLHETSASITRQRTLQPQTLQLAEAARLLRSAGWHVTRENRAAA